MTTGEQVEVEILDGSDPMEGQGGGGKAWPWVLTYGVILLLASFLVVFNPAIAGAATGLMLGLIVVICGLLGVFTGWTKLSHRARWVEVVLGLLALLMGLFILFNPIVGALGLVKMVGAWLLLAGTFELLFAFQTKFDRVWRAILGLLDIGLGAVLLFSGVVTGLAFLALVVAFSLFVRGLFLLLLAFSLKKVGNLQQH